MNPTIVILVNLDKKIVFIHIISSEYTYRIDKDMLFHCENTQYTHVYVISTVFNKKKEF